LVVDGPNRLWVADITYVAISLGFVYVAVILDAWEGLTRFVDDGRIETDSNTVEHSTRAIALNRKNALFAGHDLGAEN
jgi:hypothetical protein